MYCPTCDCSMLESVTLEQDLPALRCRACEGIWLDSNEYLGWLRSHGPLVPEQDSIKPSEPVVDTEDLKLCPHCKRILTRFRVVPDVPFRLERCAHCNGVWLDKSEWDLLVSRDLHDKVNQFFTTPWQTRLRKEEARAFLDRLFRERFGSDDYERVLQVQQWLVSHPKRAMLLAFLQAEDPYEL